MKNITGLPHEKVGGDNFKPSRKLGQNFLVSQRYLDKILQPLPLKKRDVTVEIGSGYGNLTRLLLRRCAKVYAVEKDSRLSQMLEEAFKEDGRVVVIKKDFLDLDLRRIYNCGKKNPHQQFQVRHSKT